MSLGTTDLSQTSITSGRTCAEAPSYSVLALTASQATLATAPPGDCLAQGDEVMLINLQSDPDFSAVNVGNWELLDVASVAGSTVTFATLKTRWYGSTADSDANIGDHSQETVALVRVPQFGRLRVEGMGTLTTSAWNGAVGGVLALRAASLSVGPLGVISAEGLGYRNGQWSRDGEACANSVVTQRGESIDGPPAATTRPEFGAPGGIGAGSDISFAGNTPVSSGAGHAHAGEPGINGRGREVGAPGLAYGAPDASKLTMGSGASGNLTCEVGFAGPALVDSGPRLAGGIIAIFTDTLVMDSTGYITASALAAPRDVSASGGYVFLSGRTLSLGDGLVTATGGSAVSNSPDTSGQTVRSSDGYVVVKAATVSGTTSPAANVLVAATAP